MHKSVKMPIWCHVSVLLLNANVKHIFTAFKLCGRALQQTEEFQTCLWVCITHDHSEWVSECDEMMSCREASDKESWTLGFTKWHRWYFCGGQGWDHGPLEGIQALKHPCRAPAMGGILCSKPNAWWFNVATFIIPASCFCFLHIRKLHLQRLGEAERSLWNGTWVYC